MKRNYYIICKTSYYGCYHTPVWVEVDNAEAKEIRDNLQRLYNKKAAYNKLNIFDREVASIFRVEGECYDYDTEKLIYQRKPFYCETDLVGYIRLYKDPNMTDRKVFLLDIEKEIDEIVAAFCN